MAGEAQARQMGWPKLLLFWFLLLLMVVGTVEAAVRIYFAAHIGRSVLFYGTSFERVAVDGSEEGSALLRNLRHRRMSGPDDRNHDVRHPENQLAGYYKYHPGQERSTYDIDTGEVYEVSINSHGFRGPEYSVEKPEGTIRVVTLGASSTFGYHNRDDLTYPRQLERRLGELCPGRRHQVINLGIPHLTTAQILALFEAEGLPLDPDVVTFYEGFNDANSLETGEDAPAGQKVGHSRRPVKQTLRWIRGHLLVVALGDALVAQWTKRYGPDFVAAHLEARRRGFLEKLSDLATLCRERGIELIVASQQSRSLAVLREDIRGVRHRDEARIVAEELERQGWLGRKELAFLTHDSLMQDEKRWVREQGIPFVDVLEALDLRRDEVVSWVHLTHEGNRVVAELLADAILERTCPEREARVGAGITASKGSPRRPGASGPPPGRPDRDPAGSGAPAS